MRTIIYAFAVGALAAATSLAQASPGDDCTYTYADDFSTNAVAADSYSHAQIEGTFCFLCSGGWLMFVSDSTGDRGLGFYPGQAYGAQTAHLSYHFPQSGVAGGMAGQLELDALPTMTPSGTWAFASAEVDIYYDDVRVVTAELGQAGHYSFDLAPPPTAGTVNLVIWGSMVRLDNLSVCLGAPTPTHATTWGQLKSSYR